MKKPYKEQKKSYTERKYKAEYLKVKNQLEELIDHANDSKSYILPHGSERLAGILKFTIQVIEENYTSYELMLEQLVSLFHLLEDEYKKGIINVVFRGELYSVSHSIIHDTSHYPEWKKYSLAIDDQHDLRTNEEWNNFHTTLGI